MKVAILGAGNIGHHFAIEFAAKGHQVTVYSSKADQFSKMLTMVSRGGEKLSAAIDRATDRIEDAVKDAEIIFITQPAFMFAETASKISDHIKPKVKIGVIPGTGGGEFAFKPLVERGAILFGLQRVPAVARVLEYGKTVDVEGKRDRLFLGAIPSAEAPALSQLMSEVLDIPCEPLPNYLCVTLTPSNPILHTTRLRTLFADYRDGVVYPRNPLFYEEWSDASSELLFACDEEHQRLCRSLSAFDLSSVRSLRLHYESDTPEALTRKIRSISSFHGLLSPMKAVNGGFVPDFLSRYFTADFPYGLDILIQLADLAGVNVPNMKETSAWYRRVSGDKTAFSLRDFGIESLKSLCAFYQKQY